MVDSWEAQLRAAAQERPLSPQSRALTTKEHTLTPTDARYVVDADAMSSNLEEGDQSPSPSNFDLDSVHVNRTYDAPGKAANSDVQNISASSQDAFNIEEASSISKETTMQGSAEVAEDSANASPHAENLPLQTVMKVHPNGRLTSPEKPRWSSHLPFDSHQSNLAGIDKHRPRKIMKVRVDGKLAPPKVRKLEADLPDRKPEELFPNRDDLSRIHHSSGKETTPKKFMKVRIDGTLASPSSHVAAEAVGRKRRGRPKNPVGTASERLVIMKYGKADESRLSVGQKIQDILSGLKSMPVPAPASFLATRLSEPSKPTHPFFLVKPTKNSLSNPTATETQDKTDPTVGNESEQRSSTSSTNQKSPRRLAAKAIVSSWACMGAFGQAYSAPGGSGKLQGAVRAIWPPQGMVHIRPIHRSLSESTVDGLGRNYARVTPSVAAKLKSSKANIAKKEEVLHPYIALAKFCRALEGYSKQDSFKPDVLRVPTRRVMEGPELQRLYNNRFPARSCVKHQATDKDIENADELTEGHHGSVRVHPAISCLYNRIATSQTAFDRFEWETNDWQHKYAPKRAEDILQPGREALILRDWLSSLVVSSVETGTNNAGKARDAARIAKKQSVGLRRKRRHREEELDGFVVSSDEEADEMDELSDEPHVDPVHYQDRANKRTEIRVQEAANLATKVNDGQKCTNAIVISGPCGCGKTAAIYAVTQELGFEVFEINAGSRRSGKDILDRVGDMSRNHLVNQSRVREVDPESPTEDRMSQTINPPEQNIENGKQSTMNAFLNKKDDKILRMKSKPCRDEVAKEKKSKPKTQKQSVILLEEVDLLFEEDKQFWATTLELIVQSRRPIIMTCTDESLLPLDDMPLFGILRFRQPSQQLATEYLSLLACNEGHLLPSEAISALYSAKSNDLRAAITELQFFCQMAVGDTKGGLEWMLIRPAIEANQATKHKRVVSDGTYVEGMGWMDHKKRASDYGRQITEEIDDVLAICHGWGMDVADQDDFLGTEAVSGSPSSRNDNRAKLLRLDLACDALSASDTLPSSKFRDGLSTALDVSAPKMPERHWTNHVVGSTLVEADIFAEPAGISDSVAAALRVLARRSLVATAELHEAHPLCEESISRAIPEMVKAKGCPRPVTVQGLAAAFLPLSKPSIGAWAGRGPIISSLDRPVSVVVEDIAPYVRAIVSYDVRLEQQRNQLDLASHGGRSSKRARTTRASRAALEGGNKANTRRERWFPANTDFQSVLGSGGTGWQEEALRRTVVDGTEEVRC